MSAQVRSEIVDFLHRELVGPAPGFPAQQLNGEEILRPQDPPRLRYSAGVLFPRKAGMRVAETATEEELESEGSALSDGDGLNDEDIGLGDPRADSRGEGEIPTDQEVNRANEYLPSAMGISALIRFPRKLSVCIRAGAYDRASIPGLGRPDNSGKWQDHWFRRPIECTLDIDCSDFVAIKEVVREFPIRVNEADTFLLLHVFSRPHIQELTKDSERIVTFTLLNKRISQSERPRDQDCFFQCSIEIADLENQPCFLEYPDRHGIALDDEEQSLRLLFAHRKTFAIGHGCAANWTEGTRDATFSIRTESMPAHEIRPTVPTQITDLDLSMDVMSANAEKTISLCRLLADEYERWIGLRQDDANLIPSELQAAGRRHLEGCLDSLGRIRSGIALLESDDTIRRAFALMNRAMLEQQLHYELSSNPQKQRKWIRKNDSLVLEKPYSAPDLSNIPPDRGHWRPFQLAFILMNLCSMSERDSDERGIVDLIWFPTGGGKTEAYLGLTAFTIFWRRL